MTLSQTLIRPYRPSHTSIAQVFSYGGLAIWAATYLLLSLRMIRLSVAWAGFGSPTSEGTSLETKRVRIILI